jgi:hypothetical protein
MVEIGGKMRETHNFMGVPMSFPHVLPQNSLDNEGKVVLYLM